MSEEIHKKIVAFLAGEFARTEGRSCTKVDLAPCPGGTRGEPMRTWDRAEDPEIFEGQAQVESLASEILTVAEDHADSFGRGRHRFSLRTYQHLGGRQTFSFRIQVADEDEGESREDAPTATGLVGQLMRHNEIKEKTILTLVQATVGGVSKIMSDLTEENRALRADRRDQLRQLEEAKNDELAREMAAAAQVAADERKDRALGKMFELVPVIKARLLGAGKSSGGEATGEAPAEENPAIVLARALKDSFTPDQLQKIASILKPNQLIYLGELIKLASEPPPGQAAETKTA